MSVRPIALAVSAVLLAALASCAAAHGPKATACDGRHRRPVNIHGSVLGEIPAETTGQKAHPAPSPVRAPQGKPTAAQPAGVSAADGPLWFASC